jgi:glucans biosynthesis protein
VHLLEIPSEEEIHDNIVAFWQPLQPYRKAETYTFGYRLSWPDDLPVPPDRAVVHRTFSGTSNGPERKSGAIRYVVDFSGPILANSPETPTAALSASAGNVSEPAVQRNPATRGIRVDFLLKPEDAELIELRLELKNGDKTISDVWLARWTK